MSRHKDKIFTDAGVEPGSFKFDRRVATVFEDMIARSVPGYGQILAMLPTLTRQHQFAHHNYYDLGCSLGAGMISMAHGLGSLPASIIGIDNSSAMLEQAKTNLATLGDTRLELREQDLLTAEIEDAGLVLMNFTLQFIPPAARDELVKRIFSGLCHGGALVLSEKIKFNEPSTNEKLIEIHHQYKADQGYSQLEISQKRDAIENVLIPETLETHLQRLQDAGFSIVTPWVQNLQFVSILAVKS